MDRKKFLKNGLLGLGAIIALPSAATACSTDENPGDCDRSPNETAGPFPNKTPTDLVRENIVLDRQGVALLMTLTILKKSNSCNPLPNAFVDVWHCDAVGNYSEYGSLANVNFLRGRQTTDANGQVSFITIFPGWYPGRAPHIHIEVADSNENSLRITQIAFPKETCDTVYATAAYNGAADTLNNNDGVFIGSLEGNMVNSLTGNVADGYTLLKTIIV